MKFVNEKKTLWKNDKMLVTSFFSFFHNGLILIGLSPQDFLTLKLRNDKFLTLPKWKTLQTTISNLMKMTLAGSPSRWVENTVGKGEIARYEQFLFFPQCFQ